MDNSDIQFFFNRGLVFETDSEIVSVERKLFATMVQLISERAKLKKMPLSVLFPSDLYDRELVIDFKAPYTFCEIFEQLARSLDCILMYKIESACVYVALMPSIAQEFLLPVSEKQIELSSRLLTKTDKEGL